MTDLQEMPNTSASIPCVSVIIPTYQGSSHILAAVQSVLSQDYQNIETIVVDDNGVGTEEQLTTEKVLRDLIITGKIKYIPHLKKANGSAARNTGARIAGGSFLNFLDDDDEFCPHKIIKQMEILISAPLNCAFCYSSRISKANGKEVSHTIAHESNALLYEYMMHSITFGTAALLIRREAWESVGGYDEDFCRHQDWEFVARILDKYTAVPAPEAFFVRNYTMRNSPSDPKHREQYALQYANKMKACINSLTPEQLQLIINNNMIGVAKKYLKSGKIKDFFRIYHEYGSGVKGMFSLSLEMISWIVKKADNRNYE